MGYRVEVKRVLFGLLALSACDSVLRLEHVTNPPPDSPADAPAVQLDVGLVAYYPFEDVTTACALDASGNHVDGACMVGMPTLVAGKHGMAASFESMVEIEIGDVLGFDAAGFSVAGWIYRGSAIPMASNFECPFTRPYRDSYADTWGVCLQSMHIQFGVETAFLNTQNPLPPDSWHHIALTWDGTTEAAWLDGAQIGTAQALMTPTNKPVVLGADVDPAPDNIDNYFPGFIDELRFYNRALDAAEVAQLAQ